MMVEDLEWKEAYGIGVKEIDEDHQELFRLARRLFILNQQKGRAQFAAEESIKFLKVYTIKHFNREEEYMRSIQYKNYEEHLAQHEHLRDKIVPRIERKLRHEKFSKDAMDKFLDIMRLWLTRHILQHDKAMGKWQSSSVASIE